MATQYPPQHVHGLDVWYLLSGLDRHTRLYSFGREESSALGQGLCLAGRNDNAPSQLPKPVIEGLQFAQVAAGHDHCAAITVTGHVSALE